jgi:hypothetical protein
VPRVDQPALAESIDRQGEHHDGRRPPRGAVILAGQNPQQSRMLASLEIAKRNGAKIISINRCARPV